jgi:hypothetical protein
VRGFFVVLGDFLICLLDKLALVETWELILVLVVIMLFVSDREGSKS